MSSTNYFSMSILKGSVTVGEVILFVDASLAWDEAPQWGKRRKKIGERSDPRDSLRRGKCGAALFPSPGPRSARFLRRYFSYLTPFFAFSPPPLGTRGFPRVRIGASSAAGRRNERHRNRKPRMKSLWHIEYRFTDRVGESVALTWLMRYPPPFVCLAFLQALATSVRLSLVRCIRRNDH